MKYLHGLLILILFFPLTQIAQDLSLGKIDFPVTAKKAEAKEAFMQGALLLHSFEYEDAREAFQEAQALDPSCYMAYWGEAMTHNHSLWGRQNKEEALKALGKIGDTPEKRLAIAPTERERQFMAAVEAMYGAKDKRSGDYAYNEVMGKMYKAFPEDMEVASFYALSFLGISHDGRDFRKYIKCASIVENVYEKNPNHPGALHYLIHSYDDPIHSELGLRAAHRYAKVAPSAAHALHMPAHIFITIGDWDRVVACNEDSWRASLARQARKGLDVSSRGYHSFWWLAYGYLQQGNFERAALLMDSMAVDGQRSDNRGIQYHLTIMRGHHLIESEDWKHKAFDIQPKIDIGAQTAAIYHYTNGIVYWKRGNMKKLEEAIASLEMLIPRQAPIKAKDGEVAACCVVPAADDMGIQARLSIETMIGCLKAVKLYAAGNVGPALNVIKDATLKEASKTLKAGPPEIVKPSYELYGELLLAEGKSEEAKAAFEACLELYPGRRLSIRGLQKVEQMMKEGTGK